MERRDQHVEHTGAVDRHRLEQAARTLMRIAQDFCRSIIFREWHRKLLAFAHDVLHLARGGPAADMAVDHRPLTAALKGIRQRRRKRPVWVAQQLDEAVPLPLLERQQLHIPIGARNHAAVAERALHTVLDRTVTQPLNGKGADGKSRILAGNIHILAADFRRRPDGGERAKRRRKSTLHRGEMTVDFYRRTLRKHFYCQTIRQQISLPGRMQYRNIHALPAGFRAEGPERQHRDMDQARMPCRDARLIQPERVTFGDSRIIDKNIRVAEQRTQKSTALIA